jgi:hypothetical protein
MSGKIKKRREEKGKEKILAARLYSIHGIVLTGTCNNELAYYATTRSEIPN